MGTLVSVTSKRQITLPKSLMDVLGVEKGDRLVASKRGKKIMLEPAGKGILDLVGKFGKLSIPKGKTLEDLIGEAVLSSTDDVLR
mgnify:CR=1 FL=1